MIYSRGKARDLWRCGASAKERNDATARALPAQIETILFLNWCGDPALKRVKGDAVASAKTGSALGARQLETRRDGRFCTSFSAKKLAPIYGYALRSLCLILAHNRSVRTVQFGPEGPWKAPGLRWGKSAPRVRCGACPIPGIALHAAPARKTDLPPSN